MDRTKKRRSDWVVWAATALVKVLPAALRSEQRAGKNVGSERDVNRAD